MRFECASRTNVGLKRKINEDSILAETERGLWVVADGMGGHEAGEVASAMVTDALRCLPHADDVDSLTGHAVEAIRAVNGELIDLARSSERKQTIGTTVVGLAIATGAFRCFWMGDSRAYLLRDGEISRLSHDHSLVQNLVDAGMLKPEEAESHENANLITRAVGVAETAEVDVVSGDARAGDLFLLASDGLTRVVSDDEICAELHRSSVSQAADNFIETVLARGAPDNVSLIAVKVF
ncbi:MAG TPA: protein phosphatase 2C domain-containing protein [Sphingomicrobium sp.]|jgi:serine/threonine protein phosphatase PrpC|nr:protein phosphatase 2C domain-containing protein [Sphingomicrobium sp.]